MPQEYSIIISDTSCLILLSKIDELDILRILSDKVYITPEIKKEYTRELPNWIETKRPENDHYQKILEIDLDLGEASAIALSLDIEDSILILDDLKGRKMAEKLDLKYSGTFGLILKLKQNGLIESVKPLLEKIKDTDFRFSDSLFELIIRESGE
jgi:predicted nucleic acid-binding protein